MKPLYAPPSDISVIEAGVLLYGKMTKQIVSAALIDLAVRNHYVVRSVKEGNDTVDFLIFRKGLRPPQDGLSPEDRLMLGVLFDNFDTDVIRLSDADTKFHQNVSPNEIYQRINTRLEQKQLCTHSTPLGILFSSSTYGYSAFIGTIIFIISIFADVSAKEEILPSLTIVYLVFLALMVSIALIIEGLGRFNILRPRILTTKGKEVRGDLNAFRHYLEVAEADRINFHQGVDSRNMDVDALLPYAILFGLERSWVKEIHGS